MHKRRLTAAAAAVTLIMGVAVPAGASTPERMRPAGSTWRGCPYEALCIHIYDDRTGDYLWFDLYSCGLHYLPPNWDPTWFVNNQTPGTTGRIYLAGDTEPYEVIPAPRSRGRLHGGYAIAPC